MAGAHFTTLAWVLTVSALACGPEAAPRARPVDRAPPQVEKPAPPSPPGLTVEAEPSPRQLRTGKISPIEHAELLELKLKGHAIDGEEQLLALVLPDFAEEAPGDVFWLGTEARVGGAAAPFQLVAREGSEMILWLRRPKAEGGGEILGDAYTKAVGSQPGHHFRFRAAPPTGPVSADLPRRWAGAAAAYLASRGGVFGNFAAHRLASRYRLPPGSARSTALQPTGSELATLMDTFEGRSSVQAALALRRDAVLSAAKQPRRILIADLHGPHLSRHPWAELARRLGVAPPEEPLARAVPADFYFARAKSFGAFSDVLSLLAELGGPVADQIDAASSERATLARYCTELGVETSELSRALGPEVVEDFALTGSDPYVHEGTDVTLIFRLKSPLLFQAARLKALATHGAAHGGTQTSSFSHEGITVDVFRSPDGRVRQHHARVAELELISNSAVAIRRVISTILGKAPRLADEADFRYMLARDASVSADLLAYIGDRFVERVVSPAQKIAEARRQLALAELTAPPLAALLFGWVHGRSPRDERELLRSGLLAPAELTHVGGGRIDWAPGTAPHSAWGTPAAPEPLIEQKPVTQISSVERDSYAEFARSYESRWSEYIDPIALRLAFDRRGETRRVHAEMRVLPLVPADDAARFDLGGDGRVAPAELLSGARFSIGIGAQAGLRHELERDLGLVSSFAPGIKLDWLGNYAMIGAADRGELLAASRVALLGSELPFERPGTAEELGHDESPRHGLDALSGLPVYVVVGLRSKLATAVMLGALRQALESVAPGAFEWKPFAEHRGVEVVRLLGRERGRELALYYAIAGDALLLTLNRSVLRDLIDQALAGKLPAQSAEAAEVDARKAGQVVLELSPSKKGALRTCLGWLLTLRGLSAAWSSRATIEAVLRGVPESAHVPERSAELSLAYLGVTPLTPEGRHYFLSPQGIVDPARGTEHAPEWPAVPFADSSTERVLSLLSQFRSDLSFDDEPALSGQEARLRSLRARVDLSLR